jgi:hypothetical protein
LTSNRRVLTGLAALLACGVASLLLWSPRRGAAFPVVKTSSPSESRSILEGPRVEPAASEPSLATSASETRSPLASPPSKRVRISATDAGTQRPVSGAEIHVLSIDDVRGSLTEEERLDQFLGWKDLGAIERAMGKARFVGTTEDDGSLWVPDPPASGFITARADSRWGILGLRPSDSMEPLVVELYPDADASAVVVDARGASIADARVRIRPTSPEDQQSPVRDEVTAVTESGSGSAGMAHVGWLLSSHPTREYAASVDALLQIPVSVAVDPSLFSGAPIRLVLPNVGRVRVRLARAEPPQPMDSWLFVLGGSRDGTGSPAGVLASPTRTLRKNSRDGTACFPVVETGLTLAVEARTGQPLRRIIDRTAGPQSPGETVVVELKEGPRTALSGRAITNTGAPLANVTLYASLRIGNDAQLPSTTRTDTVGAFRIPLDPPTEVAQAAIVLRNEPNAYGGLRPPLTASVRISLEPGASEASLGDTVFTEEAPLVSGRVTDGRGTAVPNIQVAGGAIFPEGRRGPEVLPFDFRELRSVTDEAGSFILWGATTAPQVGVYTDPKDGKTIPSRHLTVPTGTREVVLVVRRTGSISAVVLIDRNVTAGSVLAVCVTHDSPSGESASSSALLTELAPERAQLHLERVPEGDSTLSFSPRLGSARLKTISQVQVLADTETRLEDIDLRGTIHPIRLSIRDDHGMPVDSGVVWWKASGGSRLGWKQARIERGCAILDMTTEPAIDAVVSSPRRRKIRLERIASDQEIVMSPGIPVEVVLTCPPLPEGFLIQASISCSFSDTHSSSPENYSSTTEACGPDGRAIVRVPDLGVYQVSFAIASVGHPEISTPIQLRGASEIHVETENRIRFEVQIPEDRLRRAMNDAPR